LSVGDWANARNDLVLDSVRRGLQGRQIPRLLRAARALGGRRSRWQFYRWGKAGSVRPTTNDQRLTT